MNLCDCCDWFVFPFSYNWLFYYSPLYHTSLHYAGSRNEIAGIVRKTICVSYIKVFLSKLSCCCVYCVYFLASTMIENYYFVLFFILYHRRRHCKALFFTIYVCCFCGNCKFSNAFPFHIIIIHPSNTHHTYDNNLLCVCFYFYSHSINSVILLDIIEQNKIEIQQQLADWLLCALTKCAHSCGNYSWSLTVCSHANVRLLELKLRYEFQLLLCEIYSIDMNNMHLLLVICCCSSNLNIHELFYWCMQNDIEPWWYEMCLDDILMGTQKWL